MTPTQREAVERLAKWHQAMADEPNRNGAKKEKHAITAALLRELLATPVVNQQMTTEPVQEPVAYVDPRQLARGCASLHCITKPKYRSYADAQAGLEYTPVYLHPPQQPMHCPKDGGECGAGGYCRPEQRKPLTDEQIKAIVLEWWGSDMTAIGMSVRVGFVRIVERAHGITGEPT